MPDIIPFNVALPSGMELTYWISQAVAYIFLIGIFGVIVWLIMKKKWFAKFPVNVDIFKVENGICQWVDADKARRIKKKDGEIFYQFKKRSVKWHPPTYEALLRSNKNTSKLYLKELSQDEFEIIDPKMFVTGKSEDYDRVEKESNVRFWKNLEENKAHFKWNKDNKWDKLINALPIVLSLAGLGLFFYFFGTYVLVPTLAASNQGTALLDQSMKMLDTSMRYMEALGVHPDITSVNGTGVIP
jgi:hypothetical protein